jgi:hypothetical protein
MKTVTTSLVIIVLLLVLGVLTVATLPRGMETATASAPAAPLVEAAAPNAQKFNMIAIPLDASQQLASQGQAFDAKGLAAIAGSGVLQVARWDATSQIYQTWNTDFGGYGTNFPLLVGEAYWLVLSGDASNVISFVGDVPPQTGQQGAVTFNFVNSSPCKFNQFSLPLDKSSITNALQLAASIGSGVVYVGQWNATSQIFETWNTDFGGYGTNFATRIGYPYVACLATGAPATWP